MTGGGHVVGVDTDGDDDGGYGVGWSVDIELVECLTGGLLIDDGAVAGEGGDEGLAGADDVGWGMADGVGGCVAMVAGRRALGGRWRWMGR